MSSQPATSMQEQQPEREHRGQLERWEHRDFEGPPDSDSDHPRRLERWEHRDFEGIPYYDEDLQVPQGPPHQKAVFELGTVVEAICEELGLTFTSDHPIWFFHPETGRQRCSYGDLVIARETETKRMTADDLLVLIEVVSTNDRRKEVKDTMFQRGLNEYNKVPEFGLVFPDASDSRSLSWYRLNLETERYDELSLSPGDEVDVHGVEGLRLRVKPSKDWEDGRKIEVIFRGEVRLPLQGERERAEREHELAKQERERAEQERERAEQERERAERESVLAKQERERAEQERERAEQERERAEKLAAKLQEMGIDPNK